jgi:hypothetical protein
MISSTQYRDLSRETGIVIGTPGEFYPATTEEPNYTDERFAQFMVQVIENADKSGLVLESREHHNPAPLNAGSGVPYVGELDMLSLDSADTVVGIFGLTAAIFSKGGQEARGSHQIRVGCSEIQ